MLRPDLDSLTQRGTGLISIMSKQTGPYPSDGTTIRALARAVGSRHHRIAEPTDCEGRRLAQAELCSGATRRRIGGSRAHESLDLSAAFPRPDWREPVAVPEAIASAGSTAVDAEREPRRGQRRRACRVRKPVAIQPRVQSSVRRAASARCHAHAVGSSCRRLTWSHRLDVRSARRRSTPSLAATAARIAVNWGGCSDLREGGVLRAHSAVA
jgi:hypothetical protein